MPRPPAPSRTSNQNTEPRPTTLSTPIWPPIKVASSRQMAKPKPGAAVFARGERVGLAEGVEDVGSALPRKCRCRCRSPRSAEDRLSPSSLTRTITSPASVNLMALPDQIDQHLAQPHRIAAHLGRHVEVDVACQFQPLGVRACGADLDGLFHGFAQPELDALELELARLDLGEIQDVVDDLQQRFGGMMRWSPTGAVAAASARLPAAIPTCP